MHGYVATRALAAGLKAQPAVRNLRLSVITRVALETKLPPFSAHQ
jgi:hypothetical protein